MTTTTNSNIFRNQVRLYVIQSIDEICTIQDVHTEFKKWYGQHEQKIKPSVWGAFEYWLMCLPNVINVEYRTYQMEELVLQWFTDANIDFKPKKNFDYSKYFLYLVTKEFFYLLDHPNKLKELSASI